MVLLAGKPFAMPWVKEHIPAVLVQWYPGEQGGNALCDILFGNINPSGKLNVSFPKSVGHLPCYYNYLPTDKGFYKRPGSVNMPGKDYVFSDPSALWAFGHGLSYTQFEYLSLQTSKDDYRETDTIKINVIIKNEGQVSGKEVVQLYVRDLWASVVTPIRELKAFQKINLDKGETKQISIYLPVSELAIYDKDMQKRVEPGTFQLEVGSASDDIRIIKTVTIEKQKEQIIQMRSEKEKGTITTQFPITVHGVIRDVQANALPNIAVRVKDVQVITNDKGYYEITCMSNDTLKVAHQVIPIDGRKVLNIRIE